MDPDQPIHAIPHSILRRHMGGGHARSGQSWWVCVRVLFFFFSHTSTQLIPPSAPRPHLLSSAQCHRHPREVDSRGPVSHRMLVLRSPVTNHWMLVQRSPGESLDACPALAANHEMLVSSSPGESQDASPELA